ncbi:M20 family metallopeptidase [Acuticoccus kandeliae]|uniref:M20 family metallopeptidase n=1 Tax=Acuticoccus kandeliae TaxID=2073160 RepID=UPI000D3E5F14|nr:M20/M25/M40 family metallo-hydrolase [Acuticoccus kandeliae]
MAIGDRPWGGADPAELLAKVDEADCLAVLSRMARQKSYSETDGERVMVMMMAEEMRALGLETELTPVPGDRINAVGRWRGTGGGKSLLFNGHVDTNPATEGWTVDPWGGKVDDDFIYGIGVSNMKAGDAAYLCAVKTLIGAGITLPGDVILTYVVGELQGGIGTIALMEQGLRADYFVNSEPTDLQLLTMHAGTFTFVIELFGNTRHLSKREAAVDAVAAACDLVPRLNAMTFPDPPTPEHARINRVHVGVLLGALGRDLVEWRPPQVADYARIKGSGRYAPGQTEESALAAIRAELDALEARFPGLKATLEPERLKGRPSMPNFEVPPDSPVLAAVNRAYERVRGTAQPTGIFLPPGFFGTDAAHLLRVGGIEGVVCGPGGRYNTMPDERVDIVDYIDMVKIYMLTILEICSQQRT